MTMSTQRFLFLAVLLLAIVAAVGYRVSVFRESPPPVPTIAFITGGSGPYWQIAVNGARAAARDHQVNLLLHTPTEEESIEQQMEILTRLDISSLDAVALSPLDAEGQTHIINRLARELIVVTFDSDAPLSDRQGHVGTSNFAAGMTAARIANEAVPQGGKIAVLLANLTKQNLIERQAGFRERISQYADDVGGATGAPRWTVVGYFVDDGDDAICADNIRQVLSEHPDLTCFVGMNARHGPILLQVLGEEQKLGQVTLVTFDEAPETLDGIEEGHIYATIAQDPYKYGYESIKSLAELCRGDATQLPVVGKGSIYVGAEAIHKDDLPAFRARLRARQQPTLTGVDG